MSDDTESILAGYIDLEPFAEQVDRHPRSVRRWMNRPDGLPFVKLGNRILIARASALQWIAAQERQLNPRKKPGPRRRRSLTY